MKIKADYVLRTLGDAAVVVPVGQAAIDLRGMITLNDTAAFLWKTLEVEQTRETLCEALCAAYNVDAVRAQADVERFIALLSEHDLLEL